MRLLTLIFAASILCSCASQNIGSEVSEVDPYAAYERTSDGDNIVTIGGRILLRDPGLKK